MSDTKQRIIESATNLFCVKGCKHVTMDSVSNVLHISKRTLYEHFSTKEELIMACVEYILTLHKQTWVQLYSQTNDSVQVLFHIVSNLSNIAKNDYLLMHDLERYYPEIHQRMVNYNEESAHRHLHDFLLGAERRGILRQNLDIEATCMLIQHILSKTQQGCLQTWPKEVMQCASLTLLRGILSVEALAKYEREDSQLAELLARPQSTSDRQSHKNSLTKKTLQ